jgi:hypothetical protein
MKSSHHPKQTMNLPPGNPNPHAAQPSNRASVGRRRLLIAAILCAGLAFFTGCQSGGEPGTTSHATVQINGKTIGEIQPVARAVFAEEGYSARAAQPNLMVFDRLGSRRDAIKWGGALTGEGVTMRVKVQFRYLDATTTLLQADAYAVHDAGDAFFENEDRNVMLNHRPYQKMLDEVKKRLKDK